MTGILVFEDVERSRHQLVLNYRVDQIIFSTAYWYDTVNFFELEARFGEDFMRWVYFHLLRPIYDLVVFNLLAKDAASVPSTHSCAQQKPWCCQCPKCIYVWMHLVAYLDATIVDQMFDKNLFDLPENRTYIRKMLGLEGYKPCDCVGTVSETQVAYLLCRAKGKSGQAVADIKPGDITLDVDAFLEKYARVDPPLGAIPTNLYEKIKPQLLDGAKKAQNYVRQIRESVSL